MAVQLTQADLEREKLVCNAIFLNFTAYHLNAAQYNLNSEEYYRSNSQMLSSLTSLLNLYRYDAGLFYLGSLEIDEEDILLVIDFIHHYDIADISLNATGGSPVAPYSELNVYRELSGTVSGVYQVVIDNTYSLNQVFLNGVLISTDSWTFVSGVFIYTGTVVLITADWFNLHFQKSL